MKGLILCGGKGTRLRPFSYSRPKHLLPVGNKPVIFYAIEKMKNAGISEVGIIVPPHFRSWFETELKNFRCEVNLHFIEQEEAKGLADAVRCARQFIGQDPFLLYLGDNYYGSELSEHVRRFKREDPDALLLVSKVNDPSRFGVVKFEGNHVTQLVEKPKHPPSPYAIIGVYLFSPAIFDSIDHLQPSERGEYEITDAIQGLIDTKKTVIASITDAWWKDTGLPADLLACNRHILLGCRGEEYGVNVKVEASTIDGPVVIQAGAKIMNSVIRGPAVIGSDTVISHSYIGPFTAIGRNVRVEHTEIENSIVLESSKLLNIPKRIDDSIIGGEVTMEGTRTLPNTFRVSLGDHSIMTLPIED